MPIVQVSQFTWTLLWKNSLFWVILIFVTHVISTELVLKISKFPKRYFEVDLWGAARDYLTSWLFNDLRVANLQETLGYDLGEAVYESVHSIVLLALTQLFIGRLVFSKLKDSNLRMTLREAFLNVIRQWKRYDFLFAFLKAISLVLIYDLLVLVCILMLFGYLRLITIAIVYGVFDLMAAVWVLPYLKQIGVLIFVLAIRFYITVLVPLLVSLLFAVPVSVIERRTVIDSLFRSCDVTEGYRLRIFVVIFLTNIVVFAPFCPVLYFFSDLPLIYEIAHAMRLSCVAIVVLVSYYFVGCRPQS